VRRSITVATHGNVHRSVPKRCAAAPARKAVSTRASCRASSRGLRPNRPAAFRPPRPCRRQIWYQRCAVCRLTPTARTTAACDCPRANRRAAVKRRASNAATSRCRRSGLIIPQHRIVAHEICHCISRVSLVRVAEGERLGVLPYVLIFGPKEFVSVNLAVRKFFTPIMRRSADAAGASTISQAPLGRPARRKLSRK